MIVGLCGYARAGKDTAASFFKGFKKMSFASELKEDVSTMLNSLGIEVNFSDDKQKVLFRDFLVFWGHFRRKENPFYWVDRLKLKAHKEGIDFLKDNIVITDVRYIEEIKFINNAGGHVLYIARKDVGPANDEESTSFFDIFKHNWSDEDHDEYGIWGILYNNGDLNKLKDQVEGYLKSMHLM